MTCLDSKHLEDTLAPMRRAIKAADNHTKNQPKNKRFLSLESYLKWRDDQRKGN